MNALQAINQALDELSGEFEYGRRDCCQFAARVVELQTGDDVMPIEHYDIDGAGEYLDAHGGMEAAVTELLGPAYPAHGALKDGRPCLVRLPIIGDVMGIVLGQEAVILAEYRTLRAPMSYIHCVWKI